LKAPQAANVRVRVRVRVTEDIAKQNQEDGCSFGTTGADTIARLMDVLVKASILVGPDAKSRYRPGRLLGV